MVLGPGTITRKSASVQLDYLVHVQEIKPWPPSPSLRSLRSVLIHWENGERNSGSTKPVVPFLGSNASDGKIEFNESFRLSVNLLKDMSVKAGNLDIFQKNHLEFNLYEPRRDNSKGQLIGTAIINLGDYGVLEEPLGISAPVNCKRNFRNMAQPFVYVRIQPVDKGRTSLSSRGSLAKEMSVAMNGSESAAGSINEECTEEAETVFSTDDDGSSHSSVTASSPLEPKDGLLPNGLDATDSSLEGREKEHILASASGFERLSVMPSISTHVNDEMVVDSIVDVRTGKLGLVQETHQKGAHGRTYNRSNDLKGIEDDMSPSHSAYEVSPDQKLGLSEYLDAEGNENEAVDEVSSDTSRKKGFLASDAISHSKVHHGGDALASDTLSSVKSVQSHSDAARSRGNNSGHHLMEEENKGVATSNARRARYYSGSERKESKQYPRDTKHALLDSKLQQLENKMQMLEGELRESAALEVALYSVVAEHGSSTSKVHSPARRLSRFYSYALTEFSQLSRAKAGRSIVSGLFLVARACGSDVPRLTFWLSNSVMLRAVVSQLISKQNIKFPTSTKWKESSNNKGTKNAGTVDSWVDMHAFMTELEKVEAWIFSRIIESLWWQSITPYMQPSTASSLGRAKGCGFVKKNSKVTYIDDQEQANFSVDLWKRAFSDACERICPLRGAGHECGCLPVLAKLIMEQCVARLDVAMFNAILRESANEIPTDPVSDPISDPKVLPIPAGKLSFRIGVQLKNAIGNWSRWLSDLFSLDDDGSHEDESRFLEGVATRDASFKPFLLLNALSDLMMLPKDTLLSRSARKEVCPAFGTSLIKRVLNNFKPDEFCPDPVPNAVLEALDCEDPFETGEELVTDYPCNAANPVYSSPSAACAVAFVGALGDHSQLRRSRSSVLEKAQNSDDELDELNSPLNSICMNSSPNAKSNSMKDTESNRYAVRYKLLQEIWMNG